MAETQPYCTFCDIQTNKRGAFDVQQDIGADLLMNPAVGMPVEGCFIVSTRRHVTSFAALGGEVLRHANERLMITAAALEPLFSSYNRVEHGSDNVEEHQAAGGKGTGSCIDHAHTHLLPGGEKTWQHMYAQLEPAWHELDDYQDLAEFAGEPYLYLGSATRHLVVPRPEIPSQWAFRECAAAHSVRYTDWATEPNEHLIAATLQKIVDAHGFVPLPQDVRISA